MKNKLNFLPKNQPSEKKVIKKEKNVNSPDPSQTCNMLTTQIMAKLEHVKESIKKHSKESNTLVQRDSNKKLHEKDEDGEDSDGTYDLFIYLEEYLLDTNRLKQISLLNKPDKMLSSFEPQDNENKKFQSNSSAKQHSKIYK